MTFFMCKSAKSKTPASAVMRGLVMRGLVMRGLVVRVLVIRVLVIWRLGGRSRVLARAWFALMMALGISNLGCSPDLPNVREIQRKREQQSGEVDKYEQLTKAMDFVSQLGQVEAEAGADQVSSLLSVWLQGQRPEAAWKPPQLLASLPIDLQRDTFLQTLDSQSFSLTDADYLKASYAVAAISKWVENESAADSLFMPWVEESGNEKLDGEKRGRLAQALRFFDWTVRNIQLLPSAPRGEAPPGPAFPWGMQFRGAGYRQTLLETLMRGEGDRLQRGRVFMQLCRQAGIPAYMLVLPGKEANPDAFWAVGVLVGSELYLFEPGLGLPVPGPGQVGIATLNDAKSDPSVLRRLNVPGWFDYPWDPKQVASSIALIDVEPEGISWRMEQLQKNLSSDYRMVVFVNVDDQMREVIDAGAIETVRLWPIALQARKYQQVMREATQVDQQLATWVGVQWGALSGTFPLALARWDHLRGQFDRVDEKAGARVEYSELRIPEHEIEKLREDIDLQQRYQVRRELGDTQEFYDFRIQQVQHFMRIAKRTSTYWLSLIQYDTGEFQNARNWFEKRVLVEDLESPWKPAARYNLARTLEKLGETAVAVEWLKTIGDPQEHGNRIRARLLERTLGQPEQGS